MNQVPTEQVRLKLSPEEYHGVVNLGISELRSVPEQIRWVVRQELQRRGLLKPSEQTSGEPSVQPGIAEKPPDQPAPSEPMETVTLTFTVDAREAIDVLALMSVIKGIEYDDVAHFRLPCSLAYLASCIRELTRGTEVDGFGWTEKERELIDLFVEAAHKTLG